MHYAAEQKVEQRKLWLLRSALTTPKVRPVFDSETDAATIYA
jgi:hypothetical protein